MRVRPLSGKAQVSTAAILVIVVAGCAGTATLRSTSAPQGQSTGVPVDSTAARPCSLRWSRLRMPGSGGSVVDVAASNTRSIWVVGSNLGHWNGSSWAFTRPPRSYGVVSFSAVDGRSSEAVAVGDVAESHGHSRSVIARWAHERWSIVFLKIARNADLRDAAVVGPSTAWAVGSTTTKRGRRQPLVVRWTGGSWVRVRTPRVPGDSFLDGVAGRSSSDVWAVGSSARRVLIEHWNGLTWTVVRPTPLGKLGDGAVLTSVVAFSRTDAWAVGAGQGTVIVQWNGRSWSVSRAPVAYAGDLYRAAGVSQSNIWAVGAVATEGNRSSVEHFTGAAWRRVAAPSFGSTILTGVATAGDHVWAVGQSTTQGAVALTGVCR